MVNFRTSRQQQLLTWVNTTVYNIQTKINELDQVGLRELETNIYEFMFEMKHPNGALVSLGNGNCTVNYGGTLNPVQLEKINFFKLTEDEEKFIGDQVIVIFQEIIGKTVEQTGTIYTISWN